MKDIILQHSIGENISRELNEQFKGKECTKWGESFLDFNNELGQGSVRSIAFNYGTILLRFDVKFNKTTDLKFLFGSVSPTAFIFLTMGEVEYSNSENATIKSYQNVIIHYLPDSTNSFTFTKNTRVQMNIIHIVPEEYLKKKNNNISYLKENLQDIFNNRNSHSLYQHFGNFNLHIADQINQLNTIPHDGIIRTLIIEGHMNIILGLQLLEHENFLNDIWLPESISQRDIEKIHDATVYIQSSFGENLTVAGIAYEADMNPNKLQMGFKLLFSKTVSEYIKEIKLVKARDLLKNSNLTVSEIVYSIGYKNRSYFSRIFYHRYGLLPTEYRKNLK